MVFDQMHYYRYDQVCVYVVEGGGGARDSCDPRSPQILNWMMGIYVLHR